MEHTNYFKTFKDAWNFVYDMAVHGYDQDKQAEACEAFRMLNALCEKADTVGVDTRIGDR